MTYAFGGPEEYHGKDMFRAHERLVREKGMNDHHFDVIVKHLVAALKAFNVPEVSHHAITPDFISFCMCSILAIHLLASCPYPLPCTVGHLLYGKGWGWGQGGFPRMLPGICCCCAHFVQPGITMSECWYWFPPIHYILHSIKLCN